MQAILKGVGRLDLYQSTSKGQRLDSSQRTGVPKIFVLANGKKGADC